MQLRRRHRRFVLRLDDYQKADCKQLRAPPLDGRAAQEILEAILVKAWEEGRSVDTALEIALKAGAEALEDTVAAIARHEAHQAHLRPEDPAAFEAAKQDAAEKLQRTQARKTAAEDAARAAEASIATGEASLQNLARLAAPSPAPDPKPAASSPPPRPVPPRIDAAPATETAAAEDHAPKPEAATEGDAPKPDAATEDVAPKPNAQTVSGAAKPRALVVAESSPWLARVFRRLQIWFRSWFRS